MVNIAKLEELTKALRYSHVTPRDVFVETPTTPAVMHGLKKNSKIAVSDVIVPRGGDTTYHEHTELEVLIIYEGACYVMERVRGEENQYIETQHIAPSVVEMKPGTEHKLTYPDSYCRMIAVTIPAAEEWPTGETEE